MKILLVSQHFYPENFRFSDLALALNEQGHEVTVLTGIPNYPTGDFYQGYSVFRPFTQTWKGLHIIRAPLIPRKQSKIFLALNYISFPLTSSLVAIFLRSRFDAVLVCQSSPIFMALAANVRRLFRREKTFLWITDLWPESLRATNTIHNSFILSLVEIAVKFVYRNVDHILISCKGFQKSIRSKGIDTQISYFPYWAEDFYQPIKDLSSLDPGNFVLTFAGNIGVAQGLEVLVEAAHKIKDEPGITYVIIGEGRAGHELRNKIETLGLKDKFKFLGAFPPENMPQFFAKSDALFLSLRKDPIFEITIPSKIQSYLACGKPIIASIDGEAAEVIRESGAGFVTPAGQSEALAESILRMKQLSAKERRSMGERGHQFYEANFQRARLVEFIDKLLSQK